MREIVHIQAGQCGNQIGAKVNMTCCFNDENAVQTVPGVYVSLKHGGRLGVFAGIIYYYAFYRQVLRVRRRYFDSFYPQLLFRYCPRRARS